MDESEREICCVIQQIDTEHDAIQRGLSGSEYEGGIPAMFRSRLKELMEQKELTAAQVAAASGLCLDTIKVLCHDLVSGSTRLSTLERLADALGISVCELVEHTFSRPAKRRSKQEEREQ